MKRYLIAVAGLALLLVPVFGQTHSGNTEREVNDAQEKYRTALTNRDAAALKQIWADDYTFINGAGAMMTKEQRLANLGSGATALNSIDLGKDMKVRVEGDVAISTGTVTIKGQYSGKESSGDYRSMMVWVKRGGGWQLLGNQITPITGKQ